MDAVWNVCTENNWSQEIQSDVSLNQSVTKLCSCGSKGNPAKLVLQLKKKALKKPRIGSAMYVQCSISFLIHLYGILKEVKIFLT